MCGRFGLFARLDAIEDYFDAAFTFDYEPRYNIAPEGEGVAAIKGDTPGAIDQLQWGFRPHWVDDPENWHSPINARAETVAKNRTFQDAFRQRRCLVPANNFYEWTGRPGSRIPHVVEVADRELFAMAGIWEAWSANGDEVRSVAIVTTDANEVVGELHDRMPVILDREEEQAWLQEDDEDALLAMLDPLADDETVTYEVSTAVNNPVNDGPDLVEPAGSEQTGLGEFE